jgi:SHS2 domain-containing protein
MTKPETARRLCRVPWSFWLRHSFVLRHSCFVILLMPYKYLEEIGTADIAFEATGSDLPELFTSAADATMNVMIENLDTIEPRETRHIELKNDEIDMLLFDSLQELIYFKDADRLLLRVREIRIEKRDGTYSLKATTAGEPLDAERHQQRADVKAVTLHDFRVEKIEGGWKASVLLDI